MMTNKSTNEKRYLLIGNVDSNSINVQERLYTIFCFKPSIFLHFKCALPSMRSDCSKSVYHESYYIAVSQMLITGLYWIWSVRHTVIP